MASENNQNTVFNHVELRSEAQAVPYEKLSLSQQEALKSLAGALSKAAEDSVNDYATSKASRVLLLNGDRGVGKTSIVMSARNETNTERQKPLYDISDKDINLEFKKLGAKVFWLDILSLDPLPEGTNLLGAVFARIHAHASRHHRRDRNRAHAKGILDSVTPVDQARHELEQLRTEAVMSIEGNLAKRAAGVDPENYAISANDIESQKLKVAASLNRILGELAAGNDELAKGVPGVFVLPVDDLDIRPSRAIEMLKLAYSLSMPRLFFIFLGSADILDQALFYQTQGEFKEQLRGSGSIKPEIEESIEISSNAIASSLLRKLIPPGQRIEVGNYSLEETLGYSGKGEGSYKDGGSGQQQYPLAAKMNEITIARPVSFWSGNGTIADATLAMGIFICCEIENKSKAPPDATDSHASLANQGKTEEEISKKTLKTLKTFYEGADYFRCTPRQASDIWSNFDNASNGSNNKPDDNALKLNKLLGGMINGFRNLVDEDAALTVPVQNRLKGMFWQRDASSRWEINPPDIRMVSKLGAQFEFEVGVPKSFVEVAPDCLQVAGEIRLHGLEARKGQELNAASLAYAPLGGHTRSAFKLMHDLFFISGRGLMTAKISHENAGEIAYTEWSDGVSEALKIAWSVSRWKTYWHQDLFTAYWSHALKTIGEAQAQPAALGAEHFGILLKLYWIECLVKTVMSRPGKTDPIVDFIAKDKAKSGRWSLIHEDDKLANGICCFLQEISKHAEKKRGEGEDDAEADLIDDMLVELACLVMPECGETAKPVGNTDKDNNLSNLVDAFNEIKNTTLRLERLKNSLIRKRIQRTRLQRIGEHIVTRLGLRLLCPVKDIMPHDFCPDKEDIERQYQRVMLKKSRLKGRFLFEDEASRERFVANCLSNIDVPVSQEGGMGQIGETVGS